MNVDKVLERDAKLSQLDDRAGKFVAKLNTMNFHLLFKYLQFRCSTNGRITI